MRAEPKIHVGPQQGFFLIEALVAILIFALGILGLVAMGGTAVSSQSDAQYRTEATGLADAIASEINLNVDRTSALTTQASLAVYSHQATGTNCAFTGPVTTNASVLAIAYRAGNSGGVGLPGATTASQQIVIGDPATTFNRVEITLCWQTANDVAPRRHTLVTYVN